MSAASPAAIDVSGVTKRFGATVALDGVSLRVERGEFVGLLGPNGAGKSTLLGVVAGVVRADAGRAAVLGHDVVGDYRASRTSLGFVPQELAFDPFLTVRESLDLQAGYFGLGRRQSRWIDHLLEALGLASRADSEMRALSGGMKRRVLVAQALVHKPPVVILDEPTAGVDVAMRESLWALLSALRAEGHSFVLTTHYIEEAERLCDRIVALREGRVVAARNREGWGATSGQRTLQITLCEALDAAPASIASIVTSIRGAELTVRLDDAHDVGRVIAALTASGARVASVETRRATLDDLVGAVAPGASA